MELTAKVKTALDETRMLVLGCQVLLGFQFQSAFQEGFRNLSPADKAAEALALVLMTLAIGLLITPSTYHMAVEEHRATRRIAGLVTRCARLALWPFSIALGLGLGVVAHCIFGAVAGVVAGSAAWALAITFWLGAGTVARRSHGMKERDMAAKKPEQETPLSDRIDFMLTEARTILPGVQALLGFQLVVVLTNTFSHLPLYAKSTHAAALGLVTCSVILLMAPAAYHRIVYAGEASKRFLAIGSRMVMAATVPLALGLTAESFVTVDVIFESPFMGALAAMLVVCGLAGLWYAYPLSARRRQRHNTIDSPALRGNSL